MTDPITITKAHARRFMLAHHGLLPPRQRHGKDGVLDYFRHVRCIQFDTINVVGANADLVLQSRVDGYTPALLQELLYQDRTLIDGWDKQASILLTADRPYFGRRRAAMHDQYAADLEPDGKLNIAPEVTAAITEHGPMSSIEFDHDGQVDSGWGVQTRTVRAAMQALFRIGELGIHHRVHTRRIYDLVERLLPADILAAPDPHSDDDAYVDWHMTRRIGSLGLAHPKSGEHWSGLKGTYGGVKSKERREALTRLVARGDVVPVSVEELPKQQFYLRHTDLPVLEAATESVSGVPQAAFIAPLDNFMWHRLVIDMLFDFAYKWEVYIPANKREYGYYVLPVLYGERLVARLDPAFDRTTGHFTVKGWWWEDGVDPNDDDMQAALGRCMHAFGGYLNATGIELGEAVSDDAVLQRILDRM